MVGGDGKVMRLTTLICQKSKSNRTQHARGRPTVDVESTCVTSTAPFIDKRDRILE